MQTSESVPVLRGIESRRPAWPRVQLKWALCVLACAAVAAVGGALLLTSIAPGVAIRRDLAAAAKAVGALPGNASAQTVTLAVRRALGSAPATIDATPFPVAVAVTLRALDRRSCLAAERSARRIEGAVVVALQGFRTADDCRASNDMSWRIMP